MLNKVSKHLTQRLSMLSSRNYFDIGPDFENLALKSLPVDDGPNYTREVKNAFFARVKPTPVKNPKMVVYSKEALSLVDCTIDEGAVDYEENMEILAQHLSGNRVWEKSQPASHCYCGHQFGNFAGQLGDGAAIYLGDMINTKGNRIEIQLKGAGKTPFSRSADGRKVFRSNIREFLASEAMHHLNIPTTRAGSVVTSDTMIQRDPLYDGNVIMERASITSRIAETFIRFGSFEVSNPMSEETQRMGPNNGQYHLLLTLGNYVVKNFYPDIWNPKFDHIQLRTNKDIETMNDKAEFFEMYKEFISQVTTRTAHLVAQWNSVGFCHGVLNTDNMSIVGLTIDYGPYGFMEHFDPDYICNGSDNMGRYSYRNQSKYCLWNIKKLVTSLSYPLGLVRPTDALATLTELAEETFEREYSHRHLTLMSRKLGLVECTPADGEVSEIINLLFDTMKETGSDFTNTFLLIEYLLGKRCDALAESDFEIFAEICSSLELMRRSIKPIISLEKISLLKQLKEKNRSIFDQLDGEILLLEEKKYEALDRLSELDNSSKRLKDAELWRVWFERYSKLIKDNDLDTERILQTMAESNPRFILRNYILEESIRGDFGSDHFARINKLFERIKRPFEPKTITEELILDKRPIWAEDLVVT